MLRASSQAPAWEFSTGSSRQPLLRCSTSCIHAVVASRLAKLEFCSQGSQAGAWEPAYLLALRGNAVKGALRRELSASYALHPGSTKDTKKIERRMFPGLRHSSFQS